MQDEVIPFGKKSTDTEKERRMWGKKGEQEKPKSSIWEYI